VPDSLLLVIAFFASLCGMGWLALSMKVHWRQVRGDAAASVATTRSLRVLGTAALIGSLFLCTSADHGSIAVLVWVMSLAASALAIAFTLTWRPAVLTWTVPWIAARKVRS
jgi:hypothetical protein